MALSQTQITTGAAAQKLCGLRSSRRSLVFKNHDATNAVVIGGASVTVTGVAGGVQLKPGDMWVIAGDATATLAQEEFWAVAVAGTPIVGVLEQIY